MFYEIFSLAVAVLTIMAMIWFMYFFIAGFFRSPFVPSNRITVDKMLRLAKIKKGERIFDLGCGDGRIVFAAEKRGAIAVGYEISRFVWFLSQIRRWLTKSQSEIRCENFFQANLRQADVVFCYLLPHVMKDLKPKFEKELKRGARVISAGFSIPDWPQIGDYPRDGTGAIRIFVYKKK
jgi:hypothetical protein